MTCSDIDMDAKEPATKMHELYDESTTIFLERQSLCFLSFNCDWCLVVYSQPAPDVFRPLRSPT